MMQFPQWAPKEIIDFIQLQELRINSQLEWQPHEKEKLDSNIQMWKRLATRSEMEKIWEYFISYEGESVWGVPFEFNVSALLREINDLFINYDNAVLMSLKNYEAALKDIEKDASSLANKLNTFCLATDESNPFLYRSLFGNETLDILSEKVSPLKTDNQESLELRQQYWRDATSDVDEVLPSLPHLMKLVSNAAKIEHDGKYLRLELPTKPAAKTAHRTYFIRFLFRYLLSVGITPRKIDIAEFCSVAFEDEKISADLVAKLLTENENNPWPIAHLTYPEMVCLVSQVEEIKKIVADCIHPTAK